MILSGCRQSSESLRDATRRGAAGYCGASAAIFSEPTRVGPAVPAGYRVDRQTRSAKPTLR